MYEMRRQRATLTAMHLIKQCVKRYPGESVTALAKEYKVSEPTVYSWIQKAKKETLELDRKRSLSAEKIHLEDDIDKEQYLKAVLLENQTLKAQLFRLMLKHNDFPA